MSAAAPVAASPTTTRRPVAVGVLAAISGSHLVNDMMQSLILALYPIFKGQFHLSFAQVGLITLTYQLTASLFQPLIGLRTDRRPAPYSLPMGMASTLCGLLLLAYAPNFATVLAAAMLVGIGSAIFHPEATRLARQASGGRQGLAQGVFQVGGQAGGALGPLFAAFIIVPHGQASLAWFTLAALLAMALMVWTAGQHALIRRHIATLKASLSGGAASNPPLSRATVMTGMIVLTLLMFSKVAYVESFRSFYTFYLIERFGVSIPTSQVMLFVFLLAQAVGVLIGGIAGDRIGRYRIIWISVLGPLPFTLLLPYADFFWTGVLTVTISLIIASAFASILIYAIELLPERVGLIGGLFYGLNFGLAGIAAAILGGLADKIGIESVYWLCGFLPLAGLLTWFLPRIEEGAASKQA